MDPRADVPLPNLLACRVVADFVPDLVLFTNKAPVYTVRANIVKDLANDERFLQLTAGLAVLGQTTVDELLVANVPCMFLGRLASSTDHIEGTWLKTGSQRRHFFIGFGSRALISALVSGAAGR